ncbi:HAD domain-containing protein [Simplicispira suum]|uniref:HAD domain-containing protein n=1 Tax=Simplicispira suum TaxID=2109915 RepID=UPI001FE3ABA7|nr:HAD domain-containing protein [Simplicispira suum]
MLESAFRQVPELKLVITSTWRLHSPLEQLQQRFSADVAARIAGATPKYCDLNDVSTDAGWLRAGSRVSCMSPDA